MVLQTTLQMMDQLHILHKHALTQRVGHGHLIFNLPPGDTLVNTRRRNNVGLILVKRRHATERGQRTRYRGTRRW